MIHWPHFRINPYFFLLIFGQNIDLFNCKLCLKCLTAKVHVGASKRGDLCQLLAVVTGNIWEHDVLNHGTHGILMDFGIFWGSSWDWRTWQLFAGL